LSIIDYYIYSNDEQQQSGSTSSGDNPCIPVGREPIYYLHLVGYATAPNLYTMNNYTMNDLVCNALKNQDQQ
jgi:hypothetical protein